jgi:hypothetical protein
MRLKRAAACATTRGCSGGKRGIEDPADQEENMELLWTDLARRRSGL